MFHGVIVLMLQDSFVRALLLPFLTTVHQAGIGYEFSYTYGFPMIAGGVEVS